MELREVVKNYSLKFFGLALLAMSVVGCKMDTPEKAVLSAGKALSENQLSAWLQALDAQSNLRDPSRFKSARKRWENRANDWEIGSKTLMGENKVARGLNQQTLERIYHVSILERGTTLFRLETVCRKEVLALASVQLSATFGGEGPAWNLTAAEIGPKVVISPVECKVRQWLDGSGE